MSELRQADLIVATRVAALLVALTGMTAIAINFVAADSARDLLGFTFEGLPHNVGESADIFANNVRVLAGVLAACVAAQVARQGPDRGMEWPIWRVMTIICDGVLIVGCAAHVLLVGLAVGAYGGRTVQSILAHGPLELGAFSLALALYIAARRERLPIRRVVTVALTSTVALAISAILEVFA